MQFSSSQLQKMKSFPRNPNPRHQGKQFTQSVRARLRLVTGLSLFWKSVYLAHICFLYELLGGIVVLSSPKGTKQLPVEDYILEEKKPVDILDYPTHYATYYFLTIANNKGWIAKNEQHYILDSEGER